MEGMLTGADTSRFRGRERVVVVVGLALRDVVGEAAEEVVREEVQPLLLLRAVACEP